MHLLKSVSEVRAWRADQVAKIGLVPTMGALHDGHMSLVSLAQNHANTVIATIFVNPTQFENPDDLAAYPNTLEADLDRLRDAGVDAVFLPQVADIYPEGAETIVETTRLANMLHGELRRGHYRGVATVVTKFFNIVTPDVAVFGEKDYQQLQVVRTMVRDLHLPITIIPGPTMREADGLAMSSRNMRLTAADRAAAVILNQALDLAQKAVETGTDVAALARTVSETIATEPRGQLAGLDIVAAETLAPLTGRITGPTALMISVQFGEILLIDQRVATPR